MNSMENTLTLFWFLFGYQLYQIYSLSFFFFFSGIEVVNDISFEETVIILNKFSFGISLNIQINHFNCVSIIKK